MTKVTIRHLDTKADQNVAAGFMIGMVSEANTKLDEKNEEIRKLRESLQEMCDMVAPTLKSEHRLSQGLSSALIRARQLLRR